MKELCSITPKLSIPDKNREYINLCHMILVEMCVDDKFLKEELYGVISMTTTYFEERENRLKHRAETAENLLKEIADDVDGNGKLNQKTIKNCLQLRVNFKLMC